MVFCVTMVGSKVVLRFSPGRLCGVSAASVVGPGGLHPSLACSRGAVVAFQDVPSHLSDRGVADAKRNRFLLLVRVRLARC